jgi:hypothetical protein
MGLLVIAYEMPVAGTVQVISTEPLKPLMEDVVMVVVVDPPCTTEPEVGLSLIVKSGVPSLGAADAKIIFVGPKTPQATTKLTS